MTNGSLCASFRADNIQTRLTDWLTKRRSNANDSEGETFHKMNLNRTEFKQAFEKVGFNIESISPVVNMPILYKFSFFRAVSHKILEG